MAFWDKWFKKKADKEIAQDVVRHLIEQDREDRELHRETIRYIIDQNRRESIYGLIGLSILFLSVMAGVFALLIGRGENINELILFLMAVCYALHRVDMSDTRNSILYNSLSLLNQINQRKPSDTELLKLIPDLEKKKGMETKISGFYYYKDKDGFWIVRKKRIDLSP